MSGKSEWKMLTREAWNYGISIVLWEQNSWNSFILAFYSRFYCISVGKLFLIGSLRFFSLFLPTEIAVQQRPAVVHLRTELSETFSSCFGPAHIFAFFSLLSCISYRIHVNFAFFCSLTSLLLPMAKSRVLLFSVEVANFFSLVVHRSPRKERPNDAKTLEEFVFAALL